MLELRELELGDYFFPVIWGNHSTDEYKVVGITGGVSVENLRTNKRSFMDRKTPVVYSDNSI